MKGYIYVLSNESMPGVYKIGCTTKTVEERIKQLSSPTGVPIAFKEEFSLFVYDVNGCEKILHQKLGQYRVNGNREFFKVDIDVIKDAASEFHKMYLDILNEFKDSMELTGRFLNSKTYKNNLETAKEKICKNNFEFACFNDIVYFKGFYRHVVCGIPICTHEEYKEWANNMIKRDRIFDHNNACIKVVSHKNKYKRKKK